MNRPLQASKGTNLHVGCSPIIGAREFHTPQQPNILMDYWRSLLSPKLRQLPEPLLADQLEEVQAALRDALHLLKERNHVA